MPADLKTVLCIDDEADIIEILTMSLEMLSGFEVHSCSSGEEGIRSARDLEPDLILLDVMMPGLDGPSTLKVMRNDPKLRGKPIVLMTARVQPREVEEYLALGAAGVIAKPFDPMTLGQELGAIWADHQTGADHQAIVDSSAA